MFDYESAKKLTVLGFLGTVALEGLLFCVAFLDLIGLHIYTVHRIVCIVDYLVLIGIAGAFGLKFFSEQKLYDLLLGGFIGLSGLYLLFCQIFGGFGGVINLIVMVVCSLYYLVFAFLIKDKNPMLFLLLCCAFLFSAFSTQVLVWIINRFGMHNWFQFIWLIKQFGHMVCAGLCFLTCKEDWE